MSKNTCGNCENLRVTSAWRGQMFIASCGATEDGLIVPHEWSGETITLWRVPSFCTRTDKVKSEAQAPHKDWVRINVKEIETNDTSEK
ncbi:hypothetical protein PODOV084v1_p0036 [Vibrio phage 340E47.2]|nr:hypothetical protein PODOV084v1_p0036 [Vibrio phage 340E47.2]QZI91941.1 hypothetical protein PODOV077v1_p0030 [Vibrio phage 5P1a]